MKILVIIVGLIAIAITVYLVQQQTFFMPQAAETVVLPLPTKIPAFVP